MNFEELWSGRCRQQQGCLAFPEGKDERVLEAVVQLLERREMSQAYVWGDGESRDGLIFISPETHYHVTYQHLMTHNGKKRGREWCERFARDPFYQAGCVLARGEVDGVVAGAVATTSDVIRAALRTVGLKRDVQTVSSAFLMKRDDEIYLFADCGVVIEPDEQQLFDIAHNTIQLQKELQLGEPRVAFLSFSTKGSAQHPSLAKIQSAVSSLKKYDPDLLVDGELQLDAALIPDVAKKKAPESPLGGRSNILIFPDLNTGNVAYKMAQRLGGFEAWGPILLGLKKPYADLSRGATCEDIIASSRIALLRAGY